MKLDEADLSVLGNARQVIITKEDTIIMGGSGTEEDLNERVDLIKKQIGQTESEYDAEKL